MADVVKVEGFEELNRKLKQLPDKVKRREVLKIQRRLAKPIIEKYKGELPLGSRAKYVRGKRYEAGLLRKSVKADTAPARKVNGNPAIAIRPSIKGVNKGFYRFMVTKKGAMTGQEIKDGASRKGKNTVVEYARDRVWRSTGFQTTKAALDKTAQYIQKQIDRLGRK